MHIALISRRFDPAGGGTERDLVITARLLARAGQQITIYANEIRASSAEFRVRSVGGPSLSRALALLTFAKSAAGVARRDGVDLVLSFARILDADILRSGGSAHSSYVRAARRWQGRAEAVAMRVSLYHRAQIAVERRGYASARLKKVIAVSDLVRRDLIETFRLDPAKVVTLYNGVDLDRFKPAADGVTHREMRRELGIPDGVRAAAFVGNGFARKGLRFLIEAWPALNSDAYLVVAGADRKAAAYQRLAARLGVGNRILFTGPQSRVERLFASMDAFALPSLFEPFGNVVIEAMAAGLPVLCSAACGAAEAVPVEMREFVVANPADVGDLSARMNALFKVGGALSTVARATAEQFTWERYGAELLALLAAL
jgi:UDP-glucose:(heptosyl)LPS alpha-1,3-glucosyltransferase